MRKKTPNWEGNFIMKALGVLTFAAAALAAGAALAASPVVGSWTTIAQTPQGEVTATLIISEADGGYEVTFVDPPGPAPIESTVSDVVVEDADFTFTRTVVSPQGPVSLSYSGSVTGDAMDAKVTTDFGEFPFTATRDEQ